MAGARLMATASQQQSRQPAWLALLLVVIVISLCLGQRMGLATACAYAPSEHIAQTTEHPHVNDHTQSEDNERCSLSEQLLSKAWSQLDPMLIALLLPFCLWILQPQLSRYCRRYPPPLLFSGRRRHLVLCVFRE